MAFIQHCFIRKNTPEIINRLKALGIPHNDFDDCDRPWIAVNHGMWISVDAGYDRLFPNEIDCGDNEDLFIALAALRDDTDKNQWFVNDDHIWYYCKDNKFRKEIANWTSTIISYPWHKATVEEIIKNFRL